MEGGVDECEIPCPVVNLGEVLVWKSRHNRIFVIDMKILLCIYCPTIEDKLSSVLVKYIHWPLRRELELDLSHAFLMSDELSLIFVDMIEDKRCYSCDDAQNEPIYDDSLRLYHIKLINKKL